MATNDKAVYLVDQALVQIDKQLQEHGDPLLTFVPREQLVVYRSNLKQMRQMLADDELPAAMNPALSMKGHIIADWPFTFLGQAIVEAERAFVACLAPSEQENTGDDE